MYSDTANAVARATNIPLISTARYACSIFLFLKPLAQEDADRCRERDSVAGGVGAHYAHDVFVDPDVDVFLHAHYGTTPVPLTTQAEDPV